MLKEGEGTHPPPLASPRTVNWIPSIEYLFVFFFFSPRCFLNNGTPSRSPSGDATSTSSTLDIPGCTAQGPSSQHREGRWPVTVSAPPQPPQNHVSVQHRWHACSPTKKKKRVCSTSWASEAVGARAALYLSLPSFLLFFSLWVITLLSPRRFTGWFTGLSAFHLSAIVTTCDC